MARRHELAQFMDSVSSDIRAEYERIRQRAAEDPGTAGDEGEENWKKILVDWLPANLKIVTKGRILGVDGAPSPQVDVVVLNPSYPQRLVDKKMYLAGGVLAAFECKLTLRSAHIAEAFRTARAIANIARDPYIQGDTVSAQVASPIVYGLLAHSHEWHEQSAPLVVRKRLEAEVSACSHPAELLDLLCVADLDCWEHDYYLEKGSVVTLYSSPGSGAPHLIRREGPANPLYFMIHYLLRRLAEPIPELKPLARYWTLADVPGHNMGGVALRTWDRTVLSPELAAKLDTKGWRIVPGWY